MTADGNSIDTLGGYCLHQALAQLFDASLELLSELCFVGFLEGAELTLVNHGAYQWEAVPLAEESPQKLLLVTLFALPEALFEILIGGELSTVLVDHLEGEVSKHPEQFGLRDGFVQ